MAEAEKRPIIDAHTGAVVGWWKPRRNADNSIYVWKKAEGNGNKSV